MLPENYEIREMSGEDFAPLFKLHHESVFDESQLIFRAMDAFTDGEKEKISVLRSAIKDAIRIRLGLYHKEEFVGWSWGFQESAETFYMCNSAVLESHRRKGLYTQLAKRVAHPASLRNSPRVANVNPEISALPMRTRKSGAGGTASTRSSAKRGDSGRSR